MIPPWRLLVVPGLAVVLYSSLVLAGLGGFDPAIWAFFTVLFLVWHLLVHTQQIPLITVMAIHGIVVAVVMGLGALIGGWIGWAPSIAVPLVMGVGATAMARMFRIPPDEVERMAARAAAAQALHQPPRPDPDLQPEPSAPPEDDPEPKAVADADEAAGDDGGQSEAALAALAVALDALPAAAPGQDDLADALSPAIEGVPTDELVSALFARARATGTPRDRQALGLLVADPAVAVRRLGAGDADAAFHLILAGEDADSLRHWADMSLALTRRLPEAWHDMPEDAALEEAALAHPALRPALEELIGARPAPDPDDGAQP